MPSNLDFENLFPHCSKHRDKYYYFIHKIYEEKLFDCRYEKDSFIKLHGRTLRSIIGERSYYPIRDNLVSKGIIEVNHNYSINEFSKSYRLTDTYRGIKHRQIKLIDEKILERIYRHKHSTLINIPPGAEYKFLFNNLHKININHTEAVNFINSNYSYDPDILNSYMISVDYIKEKEFFYHVDKTANRVHTNVSNLSRELRPFLTYKGRRLINIDIKNSQPFLFNILISNFIYPLINISPYVATFSDIELYKRLTSEGTFYEYLMRKAGFENMDRGTFKKEFFGKVFFCKSSDKYTYKETKLFKELFPNVYQIILQYKKNDYKQLAITLQKAESHIMINKVCKRIATDKPEMFISSIHDSLLTTPENKNYVSDVILSEFERNFDLKPSIKIN